MRDDLAFQITDKFKLNINLATPVMSNIRIINNSNPSIEESLQLFSSFLILSPQIHSYRISSKAINSHSKRSSGRLYLGTYSDYFSQAEKILEDIIPADEVKYSAKAKLAFYLLEKEKVYELALIEKEKEIFKKVLYFISNK
jgi:hypothetical protein